MAQKATHSRKKGGIGKVLLVLVLLLILAAGGAFLLARQEIDGKAGGKTVTVTIQQGSGVATIAKELKNAGVIRFPQLFRWYVGKQGAAAKLQYGEFELTVGESYPDLIGALSAYAKAESVRLTHCPPAPDARKTSMRKSSGLNSMSTSWASAITATVAVEVCTRPWVSVAGMRWTRWTPLS